MHQNVHGFIGFVNVSMTGGKTSTSKTIGLSSYVKKPKSNIST